MKSSVAKRYAKALIDIGKEDKACERYGKELRTVLAQFKGTPELMKVLLNPMYKLDERQSIMGRVSTAVDASPVVAKLLSILVSTRNIRHIEAVAEAYSRYEDEIAGRIKAVVESTAPLSASLLEEIKKKVSSATGKEVVLTQRSNPDLIGGLVLRIDNTILDGSIKTQLELMKEKILEGVV